MGELDAAAGDPGVVAASNADVRILGDLLPRLLRFCFTNIDMTRHHQRLRAGLAFGKAAINDDLIQSCFFRRHVATC